MRRARDPDEQGMSWNRTPIKAVAAALLMFAGGAAAPADSPATPAGAPPAIVHHDGR